MLLNFEHLLAYSTYVMVASAVLTFCGLSFFAAPYGKYSTSKGFGPLVPAQLAWALMESPNLWVSCLVYYFRDLHHTTTIGNIMNKLALFCFLLHYVNRSIIYPVRMWYSACTPMPLSVMLAAFVFCTWNGFNQAAALILVNEVPTDDNYLRCIVGTAVFFAGFYVNVTSDNILVNAKKQSAEKNGGVAKYVIPRGGMFEYVSSANYCKTPLRIYASYILNIVLSFFVYCICSCTVGEIVEWWGFAILCWSVASFSFALYGTAYLASRGVHVSLYAHINCFSTGVDVLLSVFLCCC